MNSAMSGLAVLKKPFTWKFGQSKEQKKMRLRFEDESEFLCSVRHPGLEVADPESTKRIAGSASASVSSLPAGDVSWDFCAAGDSNSYLHGSAFSLAAPEDDLNSDSEGSQRSQSSGGYCTISEPALCIAALSYQNSSDNGESESQLYENAGYSFPSHQPPQPLYVNTGLERSTPVSRLSASQDLQDLQDLQKEDHQGQSPEEHIYEYVYDSADGIYQIPFAIPVSSEGLSESGSDLLASTGGQKDLQDGFELPEHIVYSSIVKPKRRKQRPALATMLELHKGDKVTLNIGSEMHSIGDLTAANDNGIIEDNQSKTTVNGDGSVNECANDSGSVIYENIQVKEMERVITTDDLASVIEISDDGTWETKELPPTEIDQAKEEHQQATNGESAEFLDPNHFPETVKIKHAAMAYGSQYYVNTYCPVASVKPMKSEPVVAEAEVEPKDGEEEDGVAGEDDRNIGAQIMRQYEQEREKLKASRNLPEVSLLDVEASMEDIAKERRRIIVKQAVKAKRFDSWIRDGNLQEGDTSELSELSEEAIEFLVHQEENYRIRRGADMAGNLQACETDACDYVLGAEGKKVSILDCMFHPMSYIDFTVKT